MWPPHTCQTLDQREKSHELQNKDRGWVLEVEALGVLPLCPGGDHMSKGKRARERSDDRATAKSNFLQDALRHLLWINIVLFKMSIWGDI